MKYFKVVYWNDDDFIPITGDELHRAFALSLDEKGRALFSGGMIQGKDIKRIIPDWRREFGWNPSHRLDDEDWNYVQAIKKEYYQVLGKGKILAEYALKENRRDLLLMTASEAIKEVPQIQSPKSIPIVDDLTNKMVVKY